jgi:putative ABC transport system permease protein
MRIAQLMRRGMSETEARREALVRFSGDETELPAAREQLHVKPTRRGAREALVEKLGNASRDLRFAFRSLWRAPSFTILAILTLSLGIGASTAIFSVVRGIVLRPLPYAEPQQLFSVQHESMSTVAPATYLDWQRLSKRFEQLSAAEWWTPSISAADGAREINAIRLTANHIPMLGVSMSLGRAFRPDESVAEPTQVTVLSHAFWQSEYGGASDVIGKSIILNGRAHTIVGVMPPRTPFVPFWADNAQLAVPLVFGARITDREGASLRVIGRLRDGATLEDASTEFAVLAGQIAREHPGNDSAARMVALHDMVVGNVRNALYGVMVAVCCVLLIACANVAHLQLMRNASRLREFAIRTAIGGTRVHLLRQSLGEAFLLTVAACTLGLLIARAGVKALVAFAPPSIPRLDAVEMDMVVVAFAVALSLAVALFFAALPAISTRFNVQTVLRDGGGAGESRQRVRVRSLLVMSEFAMALVLLTTAGLVVRTVNAMHDVDSGYDASNVLTLRVSTRGTEDSAAARRGVLYDRVLQRVASIPGVEQVGAINHLPLDGDHWRLPYIIDGRPLAENDRAVATFRVVRPGYFEAMRIELVAGRHITADDAKRSSRVVVISEAFAKRRWPGESAIGKRISVDGADNPDWFTVIGVAENTRQGSWTEQSIDEMYFANVADTNPKAAGRLVSMLNPQYITLVARTTADPLLLAAQVRSVVHELNPNAAVSGVTTMADVVESEFAVTNFYLTLFTAFAVSAVSLALIGVYGVLSYAVARRRRELGVRLALGAQRGDTFGLVLRQGMSMVAGGALIGIGASVLLSQLVRGLLYGVEPVDPATMATSTLLVGVIALLGCGIPAWRAARIDPLTALREP